MRDTCTCSLATNSIWMRTCTGLDNQNLIIQWLTEVKVYIYSVILFIYIIALDPMKRKQVQILLLFTIVDVIDVFVAHQKCHFLPSK